ncbi:MAG: hypothetical protein U0326_13575 [Polyangiales bacterium]
MSKQLLGAVILSVGLAACGPRAGSTPGPLTAAAAEAARARWADASPESLERGRQLFLLNCHRCHEYPDRPTYEVDEWPAIIQRMGRKAHLSDADAQLVLRFVLADRQAAVAGRARDRVGRHTRRGARATRPDGGRGLAGRCVAAGAGRGVPDAGARVGVGALAERVARDRRRR